MYWSKQIYWNHNYLPHYQYLHIPLRFLSWGTNNLQSTIGDSLEKEVELLFKPNLVLAKTYYQALALQVPLPGLCLQLAEKVSRALHLSYFRCSELNLQSVSHCF